MIVQTQVYKCVNAPHWKTIAGETAVVGASDLAEGLDTTITFVFATLISMRNVEQ